MRSRAALSTAWLVASAAVFDLCFSFLKHDPRTAQVVPFASDPYDSVGSFAVILSVPLSAVAVLRTRWAFSRGWDEARAFALRRAQLAIALAVILASAADATALIWRLDRWRTATGAPWIEAAVAGPALLVLIGALAASAWTAQTGRAKAVDGMQAVAAVVAFVAGLSLFPGRIIRTAPGELAALACGDLLLFWTLASLLRLIAPGPERAGSSPRPAKGLFIAAGLGAVMGGVLFLLEAFEHGSFQVARPLLVAGVFTGAGAFGLGAAWLFLAGPLLFPFPSAGSADA